MTLAEVLAERRHVLLDFDGPVCAVFGGMSAHDSAARLAAALRARGIRLPAEVTDTDDPFEVLRAAETAHAAPLAEAMLRDLELQAVQVAPSRPASDVALDALIETGHTITIVSNNSAAAVDAVLATHQLTKQVKAVVARTESDPALLKPNPHLVHRAIHRLRVEPAACVLVGDSITDITAARAAGIAVHRFRQQARQATHVRVVPARRHHQQHGRDRAGHRPCFERVDIHPTTRIGNAYRCPQTIGTAMPYAGGATDQGQGRRAVLVPVPSPRSPRGSTEPAPTSTRKNVC